MKYSSIFSMLSFFILFACNETAVYGSDENIIFMRYVEKLHLDKYSVKKDSVAGRIIDYTSKKAEKSYTYTACQTSISSYIFLFLYFHNGNWCGCLFLL